MSAENEVNGSQVRALRIGEVAAQAGVNVQTLRYYERRGLLAEPERTRSGYRLYPASAVKLVRFIKRAQGLGFSLAEINRLLELRDDRASSCEDVRTLALAKIETVETKMRQLAAMKHALELLVRSCDTDDSRRECPILEALDDVAVATG